MVLGLAQTEVASLIGPTDTVPLGRTGLHLTRLGLGMRPIGLLPAGQEAVGREIVRAAARLGIGYFDTAPTYGYGESELRLGEVASTLPASIVLSTKIGKLPVDSPRRPVRQILAEAVMGGPVAVGRLTLKAARMVAGAVPPGSRPPGIAKTTVLDYSYEATMRSVEDSLERVARDRLDIVFIHDPDDHPEAAMTGAYRALDRLRADGTITALGASSNHCQTLIRMADEGSFDCFLLAGRYSLLDQSALGELLPMALASGISMIIGGVFNGGVLADPAGKPYFDYAPASRERIAQARRIGAVCQRHGVSVKAAAIQFPFGHPAVTSVLVGVASVSELEEDWRLASSPLPTGLWDELRHEGLLSAEA